jgi:hypothetical protein
MADFEVANHGAVWVFTPRTGVAASHLEMILAENCADGETTMRHGPGLAVDARMGLEFGRELQRDGFTLAPPES